MSYRDRGGFRNTFSARDQMKRDEGIRITVPNRDHRQAGDYSRQGRDVSLPSHPLFNNHVPGNMLSMIQQLLNKSLFV